MSSIPALKPGLFLLHQGLCSFLPLYSLTALCHFPTVVPDRTECRCFITEQIYAQAFSLLSLPSASLAKNYHVPPVHRFWACRLGAWPPQGAVGRNPTACDWEKMRARWQTLGKMLLHTHNCVTSLLEMSVKGCRKMK